MLKQSLIFVVMKKKYNKSRNTEKYKIISVSFIQIFIQMGGKTKKISQNQSKRKIKPKKNRKELEKQDIVKINICCYTANGKKQKYSEISST